MTVARKSSRRDCDRHSRAAGVPPPQKNLQIATAAAVESLRTQSAEQMLRLGAEKTVDGCRLAVLESAFDVDVSTGCVRTSSGCEVSPQWRILALHYLASRCHPQTLTPRIIFANIPSARAYARVYQQRVIDRLCATAGRDAESLLAGAKRLNGRTVQGGDLAMDFDVFPRIPLRLIWYGPDEEFAPSATLLLPANIESYLPVEDIVVLSERLVSRLAGKDF